MAKTNVPLPVFVARTEDTLTLLNGDRLQGRLVGVEGGGVLIWQHKAMLDPLRCQLAALDKVELAPRQAAAARPQPQVARLANGDRLRGEVVTLDATQLVLRTWYAGTLQIARSRLAELTPAAGPFGVLYEGPSADVAGWSKDEADQSAPGPVYRKGALFLPGGRSIGRSIARLPDQVRFDLELGAWRDADFLFRFFSDDPSGGTSDAYGMNFAGGELDFRRLAEEDRSLGAVDLSEQLAGRKRVHVTILANRKARYFALMLEGRLMHEFHDAQEFKGQGNHLAFMSNNATGLRIYRLTVSPWNGRLPRAESEASAAVELDTLTLANGDNIVGTVRSIAQGRVRFETTYGALEVPLGRIASLCFAHHPVPTNGTVRCWFNDQSALTLALDGLADEYITGTAEGLGPLKLPLGAFMRLEFNPGLKRATDDDDEL